MREPAGVPGTRDLPSPVPPHPVDRILTPGRARKYRQVLARRTARLAVVVEDCHDPHNATAIIRTCDAFGVHRVFVTTGRNSFKINRRVSQGSHHYVDLHVHRDIAGAYAELRSLGYRILVSDLSASATVGPARLQTMMSESPIALVFGNESAGVSAAANAGADGHFLIPMAGFPQSLNLSVSVAVSVYALRQTALMDDLPGDLPAAEQIACYDAWVREHKGAAAEMVMRQELGRNGEDLDVFGARESTADS
ncbi:MAG: RNA methyltransferase [Planctomycetes bacterium]|nr:RNA methyltransferase [Planctomycetota bacterium]